MKTPTFRRQRGMALLIALVVLIVVSILGTTAMRSALFQNKISINAQASQLMFQGAESGIESVLQFALDQITAGTAVSSPNHVFYKAVSMGVPQRLCIGDTGVVTMDTQVSLTLNVDVYDVNYTECPQRANSPVLITTVVAAPPPALPSQVSLAGTSLCGNNNSSPCGTQVYSQSFSTIAGLNDNPQSHVQMWSIVTAGGAQ